MKIAALIGILTCALESYWAAGADSSSFPAAQELVIRALQENDSKSFIANCSRNGISVVARYADWKYLHSESRRPAANRIFDFDLAAGERLTWTDETAFFGWDELHDSLEFHHLFDRFRQYVVTETYGNIRASRQRWDEWHQRILCDVVSGKMASDFFWYIYFVKEATHWRVWRIECAVH